MIMTLSATHLNWHLMPFTKPNIMWPFWLRLRVIMMDIRWIDTHKHTQQYRSPMGRPKEALISVSGSLHLNGWCCHVIWLILQLRVARVRSDRLLPLCEICVFVGCGLTSVLFLRPSLGYDYSVGAQPPGGGSQLWLSSNNKGVLFSACISFARMCARQRHGERALYQMFYKTTSSDQ